MANSNNKITSPKLPFKAPTDEQARADDNVADRPDATPNLPDTGFTSANVGDSKTEVAVKETDGLRKISYDEATNLRTALDNVIGYHTGSTYRHDFENGLLTLRLFGLSVNEDRADVVATRAQEAVLGNEGNQVAEASSDESK